MSKNRVPENETEDEKVKRKQCEALNTFSSKSENMAWARLHDKMSKIIAILEPLEEDIRELQSKRLPILDELQELRGKMVKDCIHPMHMLLHCDDYIVCKFCEKQFSVPTKKVTKDGIKNL